MAIRHIEEHLCYINGKRNSDKVCDDISCLQQVQMGGATTWYREMPESATCQLCQLQQLFACVGCWYGQCSASSPSSNTCLLWLKKSCILPKTDPLATPLSPGHSSHRRGAQHCHFSCCGSATTPSPCCGSATTPSPFKQKLFTCSFSIVQIQFVRLACPVFSVAHTLHTLQPCDSEPSYLPNQTVHLFQPGMKRGVTCNGVISTFRVR